MIEVTGGEALGHALGRAALGGGLIGIAAGSLLLVNGRIAGISGMVDGLLRRPAASGAEDLAFLAGLPLAALLLRLAGFDLPVELTASPLLLLVAGLLVGFGTRLGNGCTSGHGVCGLARLSRRSLVATGIFMAAAIITRTLWVAS